MAGQPALLLLVGGGTWLAVLAVIALILPKLQPSLRNGVSSARHAKPTRSRSVATARPCGIGGDMRGPGVGVQAWRTAMSVSNTHTRTQPRLPELACP